MATVYGSKVNGVWRSYMKYTVTNTETTTTVKITAGMNIPNKGYSTDREMTSKISGTGQTTKSGSIASQKRIGVGSWAIKTVTWSWTRGTSASTKTIKAVLSGSGEPSTSTATATITVPARKKYTVSYEANGGEGSIANQSQYFGNAVTLSNGTELSRENYKLLGWKDSSGEGETVTYNFGEYFIVTSNKTLYAVWKLMKFKIQFDCNGGTFTNGTTYETAEMLAGTQYSLTSMPQQIPTRTGYTFLGWARQNNATSATTYIDSTVAAEEGMIFYAVWTAEYIPMSYKQQDILARRMNTVTWLSDDSGEAMELRLPFTYGQIVTCLARVSSHGLLKSNVTTGLTVTMERRKEGGTWQTQVNAHSFSGSPLVIQDGALYVPEEYYDIRVAIKDSYTSAHQLTELVALTNITKAAFVLDINSDGSAVSFFSTASDDNWIDPQNHSLGKDNILGVAGKINAASYYVNQEALFDVLHPIGSLMTMTSNTPPPWGNWQLMTKRFETKQYKNTDISGLITYNTTNVTSISSFASVSLSDTIVFVRPYNFVNKVAIADTTRELIKVNYSVLGLLGGYADSITGHSDNGEGVIDFKIGNDGVISSLDCVCVGSATAIPAGSTCNIPSFSWVYNESEDMPDNLCNRFIFKRIS